MLDKREHLLQSALPLFIEQGFHGTSVQAIVSAANRLASKKIAVSA